MLQDFTPDWHSDSYLTGFDPTHWGLTAPKTERRPRESAVGTTRLPVQRSFSPVGRTTAEVAGISDTVSTAVLANWNKLRRSGIGQSLYARILWLASQRLEGHRLGLRPLSSRSLRCFLEFWQAFRERLNEPEIFLLPSGCVQAEWSDRNSLLAIEFRDDGRLLYALVDRGSVQDGIENYSTAGTMVAALEARPRNPFRWR